MRKNKSSLTDTSNNEYVHVSKIINLSIDNETFIAFCLKNNYKESLHSISYSIVQKDGLGNVLETAEFTYTDFIALPNKKFIPKIRIKRANRCASIELNLINAKFENNEYVNGRLNISEDIDIVNSKNKSKKHKKLINKKVLYSFFTVIALLFCVASFSLNYYLANNISLKANDTFTYKVEDQKAIIVDYIKNDNSITIPSTIDDCEVQSIEKDAFDGKKIINVKIEAAKFEIPSEMFKNNINLVSVEANTLILNNGAFEGCSSLESIKANYSAIPQRCFYGCTSLQTIEAIATNVDSTAFQNCSSLEVVNMKNAVINTRTFSDSPKITTVVVDSISSTLDSTFNTDTKLDSLTISNGVINSSFFNGIEVSNLHISDDVYINSDLSTLHLQNYKSDDNYEYLDDIIYNIRQSSTNMEINNKNFKLYKSAIQSTRITELTITSEFEITKDFIEKFSYLKTLNLNNLNITNKDYDFSNSTITKINMYTCGNTLSSIVKNYNGGLNIVSGTIKDNYFDGINYDTISINDDVAFSVNSFSGKFSINKLILENTLKISSVNSINNVYELEVNNLNSILSQTNQIKRLNITGDIQNGSLAPYQSVLELEIAKIENSIFGQLFNSSATTTNQNTYIPNSLVTVVVNATSIPDNYFYGCSKLKNIDLKVATTFGQNILNNCTGLINLYVYAISSTTSANIFRSAYSLSLDHYLNIFTSINYYNSSINNQHIIFNTNVTHDKSYVITYNNKTYQYTGLFLTDILHIIGEGDDVVLNYNNMTNMYYNSSRRFSISKREMVDIKYYDENLYTVNFYVDGKVVGYVDLSSGGVLTYNNFNVEGLVGWYTDTNFRNKYTFDTTISRDLNLYGKVASSSSTYIKQNNFETITLPSSYYTTTSINLYLELPLNAKVTLSFYSNQSLNVSILNNGIAGQNMSSSNISKPITCTFEYKTTDNVYISVSGITDSSFVYICSVEYEETFSSVLAEKDMYEYSCYTDLSTFTLDLSSFSKENFEFQGLYNEDGDLVVDRYGNSINGWYNYLGESKSLYAKYRKIN